MNSTRDPLARLVEMVRQSPKYRRVSSPLIAEIGRRELEKHRRLKDAIKGTKNKLHQIAGAYFNARPNYDRWLEELREAHRTSEIALRQVCQRIMACHASTRERLQCLDRFYSETLVKAGSIESVLDLACGLNPLSIPWMPLARDAAYYAVDIYEDMLMFLHEFIQLLGIRAEVECTDVLQLAPARRYDLVLLMKTLPCLEQIDSVQTMELLRRIDAKAILISYPLRSLGGAPKGMRTNYEGCFLDWLSALSWTAERFEFDTEIAFLVHP